MKAYESALGKVIGKLDTSEEENILKEMVDHDLVVHMEPRKEYTINLEVKSVKKAHPKVVGPDWT